MSYIDFMPEPNFTLPDDPDLEGQDYCDKCLKQAATEDELEEWYSPPYYLCFDCWPKEMRS